MSTETPLRDYYVSATVRRRANVGGSWWLWTARIQAPSLASTRIKAIELITENEQEYGELQILWDEAIPYSDEASLVAQACYEIADALLYERERAK